MMDKTNSERWLKEAQEAMERGAPKIVEAFGRLGEQYAEIMKVGVRAMLQAALKDAAQEISEKMVADALAGRAGVPSAGQSPRIVVTEDEMTFLGEALASAKGQTAIRRFMQ